MARLSIAAPGGDPGPDVLAAQADAEPSQTIGNHRAPYGPVSRFKGASTERRKDMANPVVHWEVVAKDGKKAQQFYSNLFGWSISSDNPMNYGFVNTKEGGDLGIDGGIPVDGDPTGVRIFVQVDDLQAYLDKAESLGGKTLMPPTEIPGIVTVATFADPEGNTIGLVKG